MRVCARSGNCTDNVSYEHLNLDLKMLLHIGECGPRSEKTHRHSPCGVVSDVNSQTSPVVASVWSSTFLNVSGVGVLGTEAVVPFSPPLVVEGGAGGVSGSGTALESSVGVGEGAGGNLTVPFGPGTSSSSPGAGGVSVVVMTLRVGVVVGGPVGACVRALVMLKEGSVRFTEVFGGPGNKTPHVTSLQCKTQECNLRHSVSRRTLAVIHH